VQGARDLHVEPRYFALLQLVFAARADDAAFQADATDWCVRKLPNTISELKIKGVGKGQKNLSELTS